MADAGGRGDTDRWHVGDEAMLAATITWLRSGTPATELLVASASPEWTRRLYGVDAVACLDFGDEADTRGASCQYRSIVAAAGRAALSGKEPRQGDFRFVAALREADAVLFCGAGNLCSAFPNRLYERITIATLARVMGKPYAFSAQTIGPLWGLDRDEVAQALAGAEVVGTRDDVSAALMADLGVIATPMVDDALYLTAPIKADVETVIGVTLHRSPMAERPYDVATLALELDRLAEAMGAALRFIPHFRGPDGLWSDVEAGDELAHHLRTPMSFAALCDPVEVLQMTAACRIVISTRYHPLVFALGSGVPAIGLYQDSYHLAKMGGIMGMFDQLSWLYPAELPAGQGSLAEAASTLVGQWTAVSARARSARARSRALAAAQVVRSGLLARLIGE